MEKFKERIRPGGSRPGAGMSRKRQQNLFGEPEKGESWLEKPPLNSRIYLKDDLARMMAASRFSRAQIADRMNQAFRLAELPNRVSPAKLDAWAARSKSALPDILEAEFFYWAVESRLALARQAERLGALLVNQRERNYLELGKTEEELRRLGQKRRQLREQIGEDR
jgi:hypothetical protein